MLLQIFLKLLAFYPPLKNSWWDAFISALAIFIKTNSTNEETTIYSELKSGRVVYLKSAASAISAMEPRRE